MAATPLPQEILRAWQRIEFFQPYTPEKKKIKVSSLSLTSLKRVVIFYCHGIQKTYAANMRSPIKTITSYISGKRVKLSGKLLYRDSLTL